MSPQPLRILHIGAGERSQSLYFPVYRELERRGLLAVANVYTKDVARQSAVKALGWPPVADWREPLQRGAVDAVVVVVPPEQIALVVESLLAYKHPILHETPLGRPVGKATALMKKIRASGVPVATAEHQLFYPIEQLKHRLITAGHLGEVRYAENHHHSYAYHGIAKLRRYLETAQLVALRALKAPQPDATSVGHTWFKFTQGKHAWMVYGAVSKQWPLLPPLRAMHVYGDRGLIAGSVVYLYETNERVREYPLRVGQEHGELTHLEFSGSAGTLALWDNPYVGAGFSDDQIAMATLFEAFGKSVSGGDPLPYPAEEHYLDLLCTQAMELSQHASGLRLRINPRQPWAGFGASLVIDASLRQCWLLKKWLLKKIISR